MRLRAWGVAVVGLFLLAGCGDDDGPGVAPHGGLGDARYITFERVLTASQPLEGGTPMELAETYLQVRWACQSPGGDDILSAFQEVCGARTRFAQDYVELYDCSRLEEPGDCGSDAGDALEEADDVLRAYRVFDARLRELPGLEPDCRDVLLTSEEERSLMSRFRRSLDTMYAADRDRVSQAAGRDALRSLVRAPYDVAPRPLERFRDACG